MSPEEAVAFCRKNNITRFRHGDLELELGPEPREEDVQPVDNPKKDVEPQRGKDGLTADEQEAIYGRVIDAKG